MKKIFLVICLLFISLTTCSCEAFKMEEEPKEEPIVLTNEEWIKLFDINSYKNVNINQTCVYLDITNAGRIDDESYIQKLAINVANNTIRIEKDGYFTYYDKSEYDLKLKMFTEIAKGSYKVAESEYTANELNEEYKELLTSYVTGGYDFTPYYDGITFDVEDGAYCFLYDDGVSQFDGFVYPGENGLLDKIKIDQYIYKGDRRYYAEITTTFSDFGNVKLSAPEVDNTIADYIAWDEMFNIDRYKDCTVTKQKDILKETSEINNGIVHCMSELDNEYTEFYYYQLPDNMQRVVEVKADGTRTDNEVSITGENGINTFDDYYLLKTIGESYAGWFYSALWVDDHYEFTTYNDYYLPKLVKIYVSDGYITDIITEETMPNTNATETTTDETTTDATQEPVSTEVKVSTRTTISNYNHTKIS